MNREIKFRGKDTATNEWVYGFFWHNIQDDRHLIIQSVPIDIMISGQMQENRKVDNDTVGQFTGLQDKNGKFIYEGDVVNVIHTEGLSYETVYSDKGVVVFESGSFCIKCPKKGNEKAKDISKRSFFLHFNSKRIVEVIGNIHDNPDLLS